MISIKTKVAALSLGSVFSISSNQLKARMINSSSTTGSVAPDIQVLVRPIVAFKLSINVISCNVSDRNGITHRPAD